MIVIQMMINDESYNAITNDGPTSGKTSFGNLAILQVRYRKLLLA
jgi:hypothetical protein